MHEAKLISRVLVCRRSRIHAQIGIREVAGLLPLLDLALCPWSNGHDSLFRAILRFGLGSNVLHIVTSDLMLGAVPAALQLACVGPHGMMNEIPLWEGLVATNVSPFARFASFPTFGVAAPGWPSTLANHQVNSVLVSPRGRLGSCLRS